MEFLDAEAAAARGLKVADVYYTPEYGHSAELIDGGRWEGAVSEAGLIFPYIRREITLDDRGGYDIITPYGYGGMSAPSLDALRAFREQFLVASRERGLVAEFLRGHPIDMDEDAVEAWSPDEVRHHTTYGVKVGDDPQEYFAQAEGRHRTAVRKALKNEITVVRGDGGAALDASSPFRQIYNQTMSRVGAPSRLMLTDEYFSRLAALGPDRLMVLEARDSADETVAAAMFMTSPTRVHYHLSGATPDGQRLGATNLLIDYAINSQLSSGGWLHLGGGVAEDDGLSKFKKSIANTRHQMSLCRTVVDTARYEELNDLAGAPTTDYFPAYRAAL